MQLWCKSQTCTKASAIHFANLREREWWSLRTRKSRKRGECSFLRSFLEIKNTRIGGYGTKITTVTKIIYWFVFILKFVTVVIRVSADSCVLNFKERSCLRTKKSSAAKANKTNRRLANVTVKMSAICKSNHIATAAASQKSNQTWTQWVRAIFRATKKWAMSGQQGLKLPRALK